MTTSRFKASAVIVALVALSACSQSDSQTNSGVYEPRHTADIRRIVTTFPPDRIEVDLTRVLQTTIEGDGSPGTELTSAGFQPAPYHRQLYGWEGTGLEGRTSVGVTIDQGKVAVTASTLGS